jgi:pimeloyl-ACP methyl ester carboxylesterase
MTFLHAGGGKLEYERFGPTPEQAPTLVWLHEALGCAAMWKELPAELSSRTGCGSLNYSRQGHGRSQPTTEIRDVAYLHHEAWNVLPQVLRSARVHDAVLVGHSDGASIALLYASQRPQGLLGMVLEAPHVFVEDITVEGIRRAGAAFESKAQRDRLRRYHGGNTEAVLRAWHDTWLRADFRDWNIEGVLPGIQCPILIIQGEDDDYGTMNQVTAIAEQVSGPVQTLLLPGCGHIPHVSHKVETIEAIVGFVSECCAPSGRDYPEI